MPDDFKAANAVDDQKSTTGPVHYGVKVPMFETGMSEFPYSYAGSCFLAAYRGHLFVLSAGHVFEGGAKIADALVWINPKETPASAFPFDITSTDVPVLVEAVAPGVDAESTKTALDFVFGRVRQSLLPVRALEGVRTWSIDRALSAKALDDGTIVTILGYPTSGEDQLIDPDTKTASFRLHRARGPKHPGAQFLRCIKLTEVTCSCEGSYDGFSGSPAFVGSEDEPILVGIAVRGSADVGIIHVLDIFNVKQVLDKVVDRFPEETDGASELSFSFEFLFR